MSVEVLCHQVREGVGALYQNDDNDDTFKGGGGGSGTYLMT